MKTLTCAALIGTAVLTCACQVRQVPSIAVDAKTAISARLENAPAGSRSVFFRSATGEFATLHRQLFSSGEAELFAYDAEVRPGAERGSYGVTLRPVKGSPTFSAPREVMARRDEDEVRVELLEDAKSHQKIVDVLILHSPEKTVVGHIVKVHNDFFRWVHSR